MIRWLGLRRARFFAQVVPFALIFGITLLTGSASVSMARVHMNAQHAQMPPEMQAKLIALGHTPLGGIARAAAGNPAYLATILASSALFFLVTLRLTERTFVEGMQHLDENVTISAPGNADRSFRSGLLWLEIYKNLRLITRTPMIVMQCIAQIMTPIVVSIVIARDSIAMAVAFFVIFATGVLSGMFTIAAGTVEECDDLLNMSPRNARLFRFGKMLSGCLWPLGVAILVGCGLMLAGQSLLGEAVLFGGIPLGLASSLAGETFSNPVKPGVCPKLLGSPIMMIPLLGMQATSGLIAGGTVFCAELSEWFFVLSLLASYLILVIAVGLAQLRKPLF